MSRIVQVIILRRHSGCFIKVYQWQCARHKKCHFKKPSLRHDRGRYRLGVTSQATQPVHNSTTKLVLFLAFLAKSALDILFLHNEFIVYLFRLLFTYIISFIDRRREEDWKCWLFISFSTRPAKSPHIPAAGPWLDPRNSVITESDGRGEGGGGAARGETHCPVLRGAALPQPQPSYQLIFPPMWRFQPRAAARAGPPARALSVSRSHTFRKNWHFVGFTTSLEPRRTRANLPPAGLLPTNLTLMVACLLLFRKRWTLKMNSRDEHKRGAAGKNTVLQALVGIAVSCGIEFGS